MQASLAQCLRGSGVHRSCHASIAATPPTLQHQRPHTDMTESVGRGAFGKLRNLGEASSQMLLSAGIHSVEQLRGMGSVAAYIAVKAAGRKPSMNLLWAIEGALTDRDWKEISRDERTSLLMQLDDCERREK